MSDWSIYYYPKCFSCRKALLFLEANGVSPRIIEYLKEPLTINELEDLLRKLGMQPQFLIRVNNRLFEELILTNRPKSREDWLQLIIQHPELLQRPIVVRDNRAIIARPAERVKLLMARA